MILSDLPSPAEAGFTKAGNRFPPRIKSGAGFFQIMPYFDLRQSMTSRSVMMKSSRASRGVSGTTATCCA